MRGRPHGIVRDSADGDRSRAEHGRRLIGRRSRGSSRGTDEGSYRVARRVAKGGAARIMGCARANTTAPFWRVAADVSQILRSNTRTSVFCTAANVVKYFTRVSEHVIRG